MCIIVAVTFSSVPPVYAGGVTGFSASSIFRTTITHITWTIDGVPVNELTDLNIDPIMLNEQLVNLIIRNASADLNGGVVSCTATISDGTMATCSPPLPIRVQGSDNCVIYCLGHMIHQIIMTT